VNAFKKQHACAKVLLKRVGDPEQFGVAAQDERNKMITQIEEKPENPKSDFAVIGVYMYDPQMFEVIQSITSSEWGELEITSVNNWYVEQNAMICNIVEGEWTDAGTFESLNHANQMLFLSITPSRKVRTNNAGSV
jgi:glucose-1-phosphate thymidylyltransferase